MTKMFLPFKVWRIQNYCQSARVLLLSIIFLAFLFAGCDSSTSPTEQSKQNTTFTSSSTQQQITYDANADDVLLRTFYGGGLKGTLNLSPEISLYGNGTYIQGVDRQGKIDTDTLQQLLNTLVNTDGLLNFKRTQFFDIPDQDATFLDLTINGKHQELMYGAFGSQPATAEDKSEYQRLGSALATIAHTLSKPSSKYEGKTFALLVRQTFSADQQHTIPGWPLADFTAAQAAVFDCGVIPEDQVGLNPETACLKYTIPEHAILLTSIQQGTLAETLDGKRQGDFSEDGLYYTVILRPLLPDELKNRTLAMFGSSQWQFTGVPLLEGRVPPVPTPTPST